jgi:dTDP-4-dehydrorhamnose reductase
LSHNIRKHALILGGRSWLGYRITEQLVAADWFVTCTTSQDPTNLNLNIGEAVRYATAADSGAINAVITKEKPSLIFNLLLGISEKEFQIHQQVAALAESIKAKYIYASSALALDGYKNELLVESLPPLSVSEYGIFKGRCETDLVERTGLDSLILRFSSIHGCSPWKDTRTVGFLKKMAAKESVIVNQGVVQNRLLDTKLAEIIVSLVARNGCGVAHMGASNSSEELDFLKCLAKAFGYNDSGILEGERREVNLNLVPGIGEHPNGPITEGDTITALVNLSSLSKYKR